MLTGLATLAVLGAAPLLPAGIAWGIAHLAGADDPVLVFAVTYGVCSSLLILGYSLMPDGTI